MPLSAPSTICVSHWQRDESEHRSLRQHRGLDCSADRWAGRRMGDATVQAEQSQPRASTGQRYCTAHILYLTSPITCCTTCLPWCVGEKNDGVKTKVVPSFCCLLRNRTVNELYKKNKKNKVVRDTSDQFEFDVKQRLMVSCYSQGRKESNTQSVWAQKTYIIKLDDEIANEPARVWQWNYNIFIQQMSD